MWRGEAMKQASTVVFICKSTDHFLNEMSENNENANHYFRKKVKKRSLSSQFSS